MELHSRITSNAKETNKAMGDMERRLVEQMNAHSKIEEEHFRKMREELSTRVGVLEKWRCHYRWVNRNRVYPTKSLDNHPIILYTQFHEYVC